MALTLPNDAPLWLLDFIRGLERENEAGKVMPAVTVATLPSAVEFERRWVFVTDEAGGAVPAFSDGIDWRRATDRAVVS